MNLLILKNKQPHYLLTVILIFCVIQIYGNENNGTESQIFSLADFINQELYTTYPNATFQNILDTINTCYKCKNKTQKIYKYIYLSDASMRYGKTLKAREYLEKLDELIHENPGSTINEKILSELLWGRYLFETDKTKGKEYFADLLRQIETNNKISEELKSYVFLEIAFNLVLQKKLNRANEMIMKVNTDKLKSDYILAKTDIIKSIILYYTQLKCYSHFKSMPGSEVNSQVLKAELSMLYGLLMYLYMDYQSSIKYVVSAEKTYKRYGSWSSYLEFIKYIKCMIKMNSGDIKEAERYYKNIRLNKNKIKNSFLYPGELTFVYAKICFKKRDLLNAERYFTQLTEKEKDNYCYVYGFIYLGIIHAMNKSYTQTENSFDKAKNIINEDYVYESIRTFLYGSLAYYYNTNTNAKNRIKKLNELNELVDPKNTLLKQVILSSIGGYYIKQKNYAAALPCFYNAASELIREMESKGKVKKKSQYNDLDLYCLRGLAVCKFFVSKNITHDLNEMISSFKIYKFSIEKAGSNYSFLISEEEKLKHLIKYNLLLDDAINIGYTLYEKTGDKKYINEIYNLSQKGKAYVLRSAINDKTAKIYSGIPRHLIEYENNLKEQIQKLSFNYQSNPDNSVSAADMVNLEQQIFSLHEKHQRLIDKFEKEYPEYYKLKYEDIKFEPDSIYNLLQADQAIIEYHHAFNGLYIFLFTQDEVYLHCKDIQRNELDFIKEFRNDITGYNYGDFSMETYKKFIEMSHHGYELLIDPVRDKLSGIKKLIIVPDKEINLIPFELLISDTTGLMHKVNYRDLPYLLKKYTITYSYSVSFMNPDITKIINPRLLAFSPNYTLNKQKPMIGQYENLPGAHEEIEKIKNHLFSKRITGKEADKKQLIKNVGRYDIVHLAMHTELDDNKPVYSKFVFSNDNIEDDLFVYEIYNMELKNDFFVLSGCNTGSGKMNQGEGILSLARSFIYSGVSSMILTQWAIEDHSSAELMDYFYEGLASGLSSDEALQQAKVRFLKKSDPVRMHPYYWAGYIHFGNPIVVEKYKFDRKYLVYSVIIIVILSTGIVIKRKFIR